MAKKRKNYSPAKKVQILKKHLVDRIPLSDICDQYDLHPTVFYRWQKAFFENGASAFEKHKDNAKIRLEKKVNALEQKLTKESILVRNDSMKVLKEFEEIDYVD